jgi:XRE family transcriptional regulator, regulator of sulfur utilization
LRTLVLVSSLRERFGARVRDLRQERKLTQDVFAERAGLHRAHVSEIERGTISVGLDTIEIIAETFRVRLSELMRGL